MLNASLDMEGGQIIYKDYVNLGIAVDTTRGLVVAGGPAMSIKLTIPHIAQSLTSLAEKAKATQYTLDGPFAAARSRSATSERSAAPTRRRSSTIPEVAILLVGRSRKNAVVVEDRIEPRLMMPLSLSYDHRLVDGRRRRPLLERSDRLSAIAGDVCCLRRP